MIFDDSEWKQHIPGYSRELTDKLEYRLGHTDHFIGPDVYDYQPLYLDVIRGISPVGIFNRGGLRYSHQHMSVTFDSFDDAVSGIIKRVRNIDDVISIYMVIEHEGKLRVRFSITPLMVEHHAEERAKFAKYRAEGKI